MYFIGMNRIAIAIIIAGVIIAAAVVVSVRGVDIDELKYGDAMDAVRAELARPDGAKFRNIRSRQDGTFVCGEVNAQNGLGNYIGFALFAARKTGSSWSIVGLGSTLDSKFDKTIQDTVAAICEP